MARTSSLIACLLALPISANVMAQLVQVEAGAAGLRENPKRVELLAGWPGYPTPRTYDMVVRSNTVFAAGQYSGLCLIDISDPTKPARLSEHKTLGPTTGVAVAGALALVASGSGGLEAVDISDPRAPRTAGRALQGSLVVGVAAEGQTVVAIDNRNTAWILTTSITQPLAQVASYTRGVTYNWVTMTGSLALLTGSEGVDMLDTTNPAKPQLVGHYPIERGSGQKAYRYGDLMLVVHSFGLDLVDVREKENPKRLGVYTEAGWSGHPFSALYDGKWVYLGVIGAPAIKDFVAGLLVLNVSDLGSPKLVAKLETGGRPYGIARSADLLVVADSDDGIHLFDTSVPGTWKNVSLYETAFGVGISIAENRSYVAGGPGMIVLDTSDVRHPKRLGSFRTPAASRDVVVNRSTAFVAAGGGIEILDVSDTQNIVELYADDMVNMFAKAVCVDNDVLYVGQQIDGLRIMDVKDPRKPVLIKTYILPGSGAWAMDVVVTNGLAYVAGLNAGLIILDVKDPGRPTLRGVFNTPGQAMGLQLVGTMCYVADAAGGLQVIDVSVPSAPQLLAAAKCAGSASKVAVWEDLVFVATGDSGIELFHSPDPRTLKPVSVEALLEDSAYDLVVSQDTLFVAGQPDAYASYKLRRGFEQSINVRIPPTVLLSDLAVNVTAEASSGNVVSFSIISGAAQMQGSMFVPTGVGKVVLRARQEGDYWYRPVETNVSITVVAGSSEAPKISRQPADLKIGFGRSGSLTVDATGTPQLRFQWYKDGNALVSETNAVVLFGEVNNADSGRYWVVVSNPAGSVTSQASTVKVVQPPKITNSPAGGVFLEGTTVVLDMTAESDEHMLFHWFRDGVLIEATENPRLTLLNVSVKDSGSYSVLVVTDYGSALSALAIVTIAGQPKHRLWISEGHGGRIFSSPFLANYADGDVVRLEATPANGWVFLEWIGATNGGSPVVSIEMRGDQCIGARFGTGIQIQKPSHGRIEPYPVQRIYAAGDVVQLRVIPDQGFRLREWRGSVKGSHNPSTIVVDSAFISIGAECEPVPEGHVALLVFPDGEGIVRLDPVTNSVAVGTAVIAQAIPRPGQRFLGWSDTNLGSSNILRITPSLSAQLIGRFSTAPRLSFFECNGVVYGSPIALKLEAGPGDVFTVEGSTDLKEWSGIGRVTNSFRTTYFHDTRPGPGNGHRFYRAAGQE